MFENIDIKKVKEELRNLSKNYRENFAKIEKFIEAEIQEILNFKKNNKPIIPEISINEIDLNKTRVIEDIKKRGCVICLLYTSPSPRDQRGSRMPSSA